MNTLDFIAVLDAAVKTAERLSTILDIHVNNCLIGGSIALKAQIEAFHNRGIHDIDIIINLPQIDQDRFNAIRKKVFTLACFNHTAGECSHVKYSFNVGTVKVNSKDYIINVILDTSTPLHSFRCYKHIALQDPTMIKYAKMSYLPVRDKDVHDIAIIEAWENNNRE